MLKIGNFKIEKALLLAPMEEVSNPPFRVVCKRLGGLDFAFSEFVNSEGLIRNSDKALKKLTIYDEERPVGIQIYGPNIEGLVNAARIAEEAKPDLIDINCGCPVKNVTEHGSGAAFLKDLNLMAKMAETIVKTVKLPVTLKTRIGWDFESIVIVEAVKMLEQAGIQAVSIHARTRSMAYSGKADWNWIRKAKESVKISIVGNGDVFTPQDAKKMFDETGCDGVMIGRGAISNPWIFKQTRHFLETGELLCEPTLTEKIEKLKEHLRLCVDFKGEKRAMVEMRKYFSGYLRGTQGIGKLRSSLMAETELAPVLEKLDGFCKV
ncbi:tRNA dihydrouridine synthase DusB [bacterium]|nr:tRNA dihydrouridine synthase DusB [bacterium]